VKTAGKSGTFYQKNRIFIGNPKRKGGKNRRTAGGIGQERVNQQMTSRESKLRVALFRK